MKNALSGGMKSVPDMENISSLSKKCAEDVSKNISDRQNDVRGMCFWNIYNRIQITREILSFYGKSWDAAHMDINDEELGGEIAERIVTVTKNLFVDIVSTIEKTSKESVSLYESTGVKKRSLDNRSFLYLRNIIQASSELKIISTEEFQEWDDILVMRNLAAHNNSVSDRSKKFEIAGITISMRPGRMMKGPVNTFIILSERIIDLFYHWLKAMDAESKKKTE